MARPGFSSLASQRRLRATDADRDAYGDIVSKAYSEGQLDATTFEYRSTNVLNAKTVGELDALVADLVTPETAAALAARPSTDPVITTPRPKRALTGVVVITAAALVVAGAIGAVVYATSAVTDLEVGTVDDGGIAVPPLDWPGAVEVDMYSEEGLEIVVADIIEAAGRSEFTWLGLYGEYALATGPGAAGATRMADYDWRGPGQVTKSPGSRELEEGDLFDLDQDPDGETPPDVDLAAVARLASTASRETGVVDPTSLYVSIDRTLGTADRLVEIRVSLSNDYQDGYVRADHTGEIIDITGPAVEPVTNRFLQPENMAQAIAALRTRIGHDEVTELRFYTSYVAAEAPPEAGATVVDEYEYRGGSFAAKQSYTPIQPGDVRASVFSLDSVDAGVVAQSIEAALAAVDLADATVSYVYVQRPQRPAGHEPVIVVLVDNAYESTHVIYSLSGEQLQVGDG